ncbi:hypothetical protein [Acidovorax sp. CCYZU-2555]|nr:hypothetical protein [Acidovorax sp. CCYZU-2555]
MSTAGPTRPAQPLEGLTMRSILLFLLGIPIPIIILIALFT